MPYQKLLHRHDRLRSSRLLLDLARLLSEAIYGEEPLGATLDGVLVAACVIIGHAENRMMNVSKLAYYLGMSRQTVYRRLDELVAIGMVQRTGQYYHLAQERNDAPTAHLSRANILIEAAWRDLQLKSLPRVRSASESTVDKT